MSEVPSPTGLGMWRLALGSFSGVGGGMFSTARLVSSEPPRSRLGTRELGVLETFLDCLENSAIEKYNDQEIVKKLATAINTKNPERESCKNKHKTRNQ